MNAVDNDIKVSNIKEKYQQIINQAGRVESTHIKRSNTMTAEKVINECSNPKNFLQWKNGKLQTVFAKSNPNNEKETSVDVFRKTSNITQEIRAQIQESPEQQRRNKNFNNKILEIKKFKTTENMDKSSLFHNNNMISKNSSNLKNNKRITLTRNSEISKTFSTDVEIKDQSQFENVNKHDRSNLFKINNNKKCNSFYDEKMNKTFVERNRNNNTNIPSNRSNEIKKSQLEKDREVKKMFETHIGGKTFETPNEIKKNAFKLPMTPDIKSVSNRDIKKRPAPVLNNNLLNDINLNVNANSISITKSNVIKNLEKNRGLYEKVKKAAMINETNSKKNSNKIFSQKKNLGVEFTRKIQSTKNEMQQTYCQLPDVQDNFSSNLNVKNIKNGLNFPKVTCKSFVIMDTVRKELIWGKNMNAKRECASLTKIMTCQITINFLKSHKLDTKNVYYYVSEEAGNINGTSANLKPFDFVSLGDLLYALMLPSGNDAAICLAENVGTHMYLNSEEYRSKKRMLYYDDSRDTKLQHPEKLFYEEMNKMAQAVGMRCTNYTNPHGLNNISNHSSAYDQAILSLHCLKNPLFKKIVNTKQYECFIEREDNDVEITWKNTNKLQNKGYCGIKTGITSAAGPCLSCFYENDEMGICVVVLGCNKMNDRFNDCDLQTQWVVKNYKALQLVPNNLRERDPRVVL